MIMVQTSTMSNIFSVSVAFKKKIIHSWKLDGKIFIIFPWCEGVGKDCRV